MTKQKEMYLEAATSVTRTGTPKQSHMQGEMIGNYVVEHFDEMDLNGDGKISYAMFWDSLEMQKLFTVHSLL